MCGKVRENTGKFGTLWKGDVIESISVLHVLKNINAKQFNKEMGTKIYM